MQKKYCMPFLMSQNYWHMPYKSNTVDSIKNEDKLK